MRNGPSSSSSSSSSRSGPGARERKPSNRNFVKTKKFCKFCKENVSHVDFKNAELLRGFVPERARIQPRRLSGACASHQRQITQAIKRARHLALIPFQSD